MQRLRERLTYANVVSSLALFLVIAGGTAYAANTILTTDIVDNEVYSRDVRNDNLPGGGLTHPDLRPNSVRSSEVGAESLTGADVADQSGVDTCVSSTVRIGQLCFRAENVRPQLEPGARILR